MKKKNTSGLVSALDAEMRAIRKQAKLKAKRYAKRNLSRDLRAIREKAKRKLDHDRAVILLSEVQEIAEAFRLEALRTNKLLLSHISEKEKVIKKRKKRD
jgi:hypothetical protein